MRFRRGRSKYNARRTEIDGIKFDSLREARRYSELKLRQKAGEIGDLAVHPTFPIEHNGVKVCNVELDFAYTQRDALDKTIFAYEDVKGLDTRMSRLKRKLLRAFYGIDVEVIR